MIHGDIKDAGNGDIKIEYTESFFLSAGEANAEGEIALTHLTARLIDIATAHANHLGIGNPFMPDNHTGWVLSRLTIDMTDYPHQDSVYTVTTWVESWNRHYSERCFRIAGAEGNVYGYARSVWMVLDTETHSNAGLTALPFRNEFISNMECPIARQARHSLIILPEDAESAPARSIVANCPVDTIRFRYSDLDAYRHVNTIRYVAKLMDRYSLEEHDTKYVNRLELSFLHECKYNTPIHVLTHHTEECDTYLFREADSERVPLLYARVYRKMR